jgi:hypothetical protein
MNKTRNDTTQLKTGKVAILISSCDRYQDLWKPFFTLFFKYWPDCPYPVYLSTNHKIYDNPRVNTICMGEDVDWSTGFRFSLEQVPYEYVIVMMEDFLPIRSVDNHRIEKLVLFMEKKGAGCLRLYPCPGPDLPCPDNQEVGEIRKGTDYRLSLQTAIWDKKILLELLRDGESAWQLETKGTKRTNELDVPFLSVTGKTEDSPIPYFCTAVVKGKWVKEAVQLCEMEGIEVDLRSRPIQTSIDLFRYSGIAGKMYWFYRKIVNKKIFH